MNEACHTTTHVLIIVIYRILQSKASSQKGIEGTATNGEDQDVCCQSEPNEPQDGTQDCQKVRHEGRHRKEGGFCLVDSSNGLICVSVVTFDVALTLQEKPEWAAGTAGKKETDTKSEATDGDVAIEEEEE